MNIEITRKQVAALAKALKRPDATYLQTLDTIATCLGFQNQAALMARLNAEAPATTADARPDAPPKPFRAVIAFGDRMTDALQWDEPITAETEGELRYVEFSTREEYHAYLTGLEAAEDWLGHDVAASMSGNAYGADERPEFFDEAREYPVAEFVAWHNARVEKELDEEPGD